MYFTRVRGPRPLMAGVRCLKEQRDVFYSPGVNSMTSAKARIFAVIVVILAACFHVPHLGGECLEPKNDTLERLRGLDPSSEADRYQYYSNTGCLYSGLFEWMTSYKAFATPKAISLIRKENESTTERVYHILPPLLQSPFPEVRCEAARALAYYGWKESYEYLISCDRDYQRTAILLAILGDERGKEWIIDKYKKLFGDPQTGKDGPESQEVVGKWVLLNALYHFASPDVLPFINGVIASSKKNYDVRSRALVVRKRIYELYPETVPD